MTSREQYVQAQEVAPDVFRLELPTPFKVGPVNVYLVKGEKLTLVDVGPLTEEAWQALQTGLDSIGISVEQIEQVVLTHHHVDHCGLLERVRQVSKAQTLAHPLAAPYIELDKEFIDFHDRFFYGSVQTEWGSPGKDVYHRAVPQAHGDIFPDEPD